MSTWQQAESSERRQPHLRKYLHKIQLYGIFLINNRSGRAQPMVGGAISELVVFLGFYKKEGWASQGKPASKQPLHGLCLSPCLQVPALLEFLSWLPLVITAMWKWKWHKPFPLQLAFWSWCFVVAIETLRQHFLHYCWYISCPPAETSVCARDVLLYFQSGMINNLSACLFFSLNLQF